MWKRSYTKQTCWSKNKTNKNLGFLGNDLEQVSVCMNLACVHRLVHAYANPYSENLKTHKQSSTLKQQTNNLRTKKKRGKELKG